MIFEIYYVIKRDCRIFEIREKIKFAEPKRVIMIKMSL